MADLEAISICEDVCVDEESEDGEVLDLEGQGLTSIILPEDANPQTLILNNNDLSKLDGLDIFSGLSQLSAVSNHIVRMNGLHTLNSLTVLSLSNNSIGEIEELENLSQLMWLDLSSNSIKVIENLPKGGKLHYLDLSDNDITHISDLSTLNNLKTLLLHSNNISSLKNAQVCLPQSLGVLSLSDNNICDLNEISFVACLLNLQQLSLAENPCVLKTTDSKGFDYRPFVWNWCPSLQILDALVITEKERLLGEWLYSQGKGRQFHTGEHAQLVDYLVTACPLTSAEQLRPEDNKLGQILSQQRRYQQQLQQQHHRQQQQHIQTSSSLFNQQEANSYLVNQTEANRHNRISTSHSVEDNSEQSDTRSTWANHADLSALSHSSSNLRAGYTSDLILQDLSHDCDARSSVSLLESESVYLPFDVPASPIVLRCSSFTTPEKQFHLSSKSVSLVTTAAAEKQHVPGTHQTQLFTDHSENRYNSLEQRPICPLNQHISRSFQRPNLHLTRPLTSSSEPSVSTHKDNTLQTARSQDYESGSEQTASESESFPQELYKSHSAMNTVMENNTKLAPQDKLSHIKTVAGNKKVVHHTNSEVQEKTRTAVKIRGGPNLIMKTLFTTNTTSITTTTASNIATAALARACHLKASAIPAESDVPKTKIPETTNTTDQYSSKLDRSDNVGTGDSKLIKGKLNQERMEQKKNIAISIVNKAATTIQSFWRGYRTRHFNIQVISVHKEIRARRAEDHILLLRQDLERNRKLYEEEKQMRVLQMEAIRLLYKEVQDLKTHNLNSNKDLCNLVDHNGPVSTAIRLSPGPTATSTISPVVTSYSELNRTQELEKTCASLQSQVSQLQEALESVSSAVFKTNSLDNASFDITDHNDKIVVTPVSDSAFTKDYHSDEASQWGCIPHSLSPYPSEEEDIYYRQVSTQGAPTPPRHLQLRHHSHQALLLSWQAPSCCGQNWEEEGNKHIIGHRIYVNDQLKAFICQKTCALVEGLNPSTIYKFCVKALSGFGESFESNIIMAKLARGQEKTKFEANNGTDSSQDSDKDFEFTDINEKARSKIRKIRKSSRSSEKVRGAKLFAHHKKKLENFSELGEEVSTVINTNNNCMIDNTEFAILTHPKLHSHRRHRNKDLSCEGSKHYPSDTTSQESSPCAGTVTRVEDKKPKELSSTSSPMLSSFSRNLNFRRLQKFSKSVLKQEEDLSDIDNENKSSYTPANESFETYKKNSPSMINESPLTGSRRYGSPSSHRRMRDVPREKGEKPSPHVSPVSGTDNENRKEHLQEVERRMYP